MKLTDLPSSMTDWSTLPSSEHPVNRHSRHSRQFGRSRFRVVGLVRRTLVSHWCQRSPDLRRFETNG